MILLTANSEERKQGWSWSFRTMRAIQRKLSETEIDIELEQIDEILSLLNEESLLSRKDINFQ